MKKYYIVTEEDLKRFEVMSQIKKGNLTVRLAQQILGLSYRQCLRIKERFIKEGFEGLLRKNPLTANAQKVTEELKNNIVMLRETFYWDFNILHFKEKLEQNHGISLSYETVRKILIKDGLHEVNKRRTVYRRRRRMPKEGMLVQMDSSQHRWIESVHEPWWLVAMVDDASGWVYAEFHPSETVWANMKVLRAYIEQKGVFMALYTDKASHFKTTRHGGLHYQVEVEQKETQIERALSELGIKLINANTPQAKGRIERRFRFFQDRLIKEMRLRGIRDYKEANEFLKKEFLPWCNQRYTVSVESVYSRVPRSLELDIVFSVRHPRRVNNDNTVRYCGSIYQILPMNGTKSFARKRVEVCELMDERREILWEGKRLNYVEVTDSEEKEKEKIKVGDEILNLRVNTEEKEGTERRRYKPSADHPWKRGYKNKNVTFYHSNKV